jgi:hypothetical protein
VLPWRAPAAGGAVTVFLALWVLLVARNPGKLGTLTSFTASDSLEFDELVLTDRDGKPLEKVRETIQGPRKMTERYKKVGEQFWLDGQPNSKELPQRPDGMIARKGDQDYLFLPDRNPDGTFKVNDRTQFGIKFSGMLEYRDKQSGQTMEEGQLGRISTFYFGRFLANILLNLLLLAVWFLVLWLCLEFQWPHALGQAVVLWLATTIFALPPLFSQGEALSQPPPPPPVVKTTLTPSACELPIHG